MIQAFDMLVNDLTEVLKVKQVINLDINKVDWDTWAFMCDKIKLQTGREKSVFKSGPSSNQEGRFIFDSSGRSFELRDVYRIIDKLTEHYAVIIMSTIKTFLQKKSNLCCYSTTLIYCSGWVIINACDYFVGCDSMGQHYVSCFE